MGYIKINIPEVNSCSSTLNSARSSISTAISNVSSAGSSVPHEISYKVSSEFSSVSSALREIDRKIAAIETVVKYGVAQYQMNESDLLRRSRLGNDGGGSKSTWADQFISEVKSKLDPDNIFSKIIEGGIAAEDIIENIRLNWESIDAKLEELPEEEPVEENAVVAFLKGFFQIDSRDGSETENEERKCDFLFFDFGYADAKAKPLSFILGKGSKLTNDQMAEWNKDHKQPTKISNKTGEKLEGKWHYDSDQKKMVETTDANEPPKWTKNQLALLGVGASASASASVLHVGDEGYVDWTPDWVPEWAPHLGADGKCNLDVLKADAQAGFQAGLYTYEMEEDGSQTRKFSPGVMANASASVSVLEADAEGRIGFGEDHDQYGLYGKIKVEGLEAEANAILALTKDEQRLTLGAEANLVEAEATGGVSILGADVGVKGSVTVGIGAKADVGFTDGVFKCEVGASVGVGFSVGLEVDVGGIVDGAVELGQDIWEGACDIGESVCEWGSDMIDGASDFFSDVGDGIGDFFGWW